VRGLAPRYGKHGDRRLPLAAVFELLRPGSAAGQDSVFAPSESLQQAAYFQASLHSTESWQPWVERARQGQPLLVRWRWRLQLVLAQHRRRSTLRLSSSLQLLHLSLSQVAVFTCQRVLHCHCTIITESCNGPYGSFSLPLIHCTSSEADLHTSSNSLSESALCCAGQWSCQSELWVWPVEPDQLSLWQGSIHQCQQPLPGGLTSGRLWGVLPVDL